MIFNYFYDCFCPRIIDEIEIQRDGSDDSIATVLPFDFIPEDEFNHHRVSNTSCNSSAVEIVYKTSVARNNHG